jgi:hypothetical protein
MRFAKAEVIEAFEREDTSYRLAILCTHWLRDTAHFKPSAIGEAQGLKMQAGGKWISFADLAERLEQQSPRDVIVSDFILTQLHALIRAPFEILSDYCEDYDKEVTNGQLLSELKRADWYWFARMIRNAVSHNFHFDFKHDKDKLPVTWNGVTLTEDLQGTPITYKSFWHKPGYELFLEMKAFAATLPEPDSAITCTSNE